jgi:hypothetical protein
MWNAEHLWLVTQTRRISPGSGSPVRANYDLRPPRAISLV